MQATAKTTRATGGLAHGGEIFAMLDKEYLLPSLLGYFGAMNQARSRIAHNALVAYLNDDAEARAAAKDALHAVARWQRWEPPWFTAHGQHTYYPAGELAVDVAFAYDDLCAATGAWPIEHPAPAHEESDVSTAGIIKFGIALTVATGVVCLLVWGLFSVFNSQAAKTERRAPPLYRGDRLPPEPRLQGMPGHQSFPPEDIREFRAKENAELNSYGWVIQPTGQRLGVVRIPIEEAKKLIVASRKRAAHAARKRDAAQEAGVRAIPVDDALSCSARHSSAIWFPG